MEGQMTLDQFMPREKPAMHEPGIYSRSGRQHITMERIGSDIQLAIWTDDEAMICRVDLKEFEEYMRSVIDGNMDKSTSNK